MKIGFVGGGKMAEAIVASLLDAQMVEAADVIVSDISHERREALAAQYGIGVTESNAAVVSESDTVVLAVKPQDLDTVLEGVAPNAADRLIISIAAGKPLAYFETQLPGARIVRVMPNLACQVGEGMSAYCGGGTTTAADLDWVAQILGCAGRALELPEALFDVVTALSGSGPAFFAYALKAMVDGAVCEGMEPDAALMLAEQTMLGTAKVLIEKGVSPADFMAQVASKGGTTAAGLAVLADSPVASALQSTIKAAADRSRELSA